MCCRATNYNYQLDLTCEGRSHRPMISKALELGPKNVRIIEVQAALCLRHDIVQGIFVLPRSCEKYQRLEI